MKGENKSMCKKKIKWQSTQIYPESFKKNMETINRNAEELL